MSFNLVLCLCDHASPVRDVRLPSGLGSKRLLRSLVFAFAPVHPHCSRRLGRFGLLNNSQNVVLTDDGILLAVSPTKLRFAGTPPF